MFVNFHIFPNEHKSILKNMIFFVVVAVDIFLCDKKKFSHFNHTHIQNKNYQQFSGSSIKSAGNFLLYFSYAFPSRLTKHWGSSLFAIHKNDFLFRWEAKKNFLFSLLLRLFARVHSTFFFMFYFKSMLRLFFGCVCVFGSARGWMKIKLFLLL